MSRRLRATIATVTAVAAAACLGQLVSPLGGAQAANTASASYGWGKATQVWDWERGESTDGWREFADGTGQVAIYYGQLGLDSGPASHGSSATSRGDVVAWLGGNAHSRGRWEFRMKSKQWAIAAPYQIRLELVPADTAPTSCGTTTVTLASWKGYTSSTPPATTSTAFGVTSGTSTWTGAAAKLPQANTFHSYALQITDKWMTWFVDGKPVGRLYVNTAPSAFATPLVPRLVLDGAPGTPMTHTNTTIDWDRYYDLSRAGTSIPTSTSLSKQSAPVSGMC
jgi:hypothetical protein